MNLSSSTTEDCNVIISEGSIEKNDDNSSSSDCNSDVIKTITQESTNTNFNEVRNRELSLMVNNETDNSQLIDSDLILKSQKSSTDNTSATKCNSGCRDLIEKLPQKSAGLTDNEEILIAKSSFSTKNYETHNSPSTDYNSYGDALSKSISGQLIRMGTSKIQIAESPPSTINDEIDYSPSADCNSCCDLNTTPQGLKSKSNETVGMFSHNFMETPDASPESISISRESPKKRKFIDKLDSPSKGLSTTIETYTSDSCNFLIDTEYAANLNHHEMPQPTPGVAPTPPSVPVQQQQQQQSKEFNTASLCRLGQETVQDIVSRTQEVFQTLKQIQPPNGTPQSLNASNEKKARVQELLRTIRVLFKRLRLIYEKCNENCQLQGMEYTHIESLIPFKDELDPKHDEKKNSEAYRLACEESKEVMEQVILKNKQLKEVIDHLRRIIWEINTMLTMRKS
ncbi:uncharacterized protein LOC130900396 isoform X1 [Diorhabda carinulata]|uniref:uncharacterized protein LOC130900396 isoform X1 n=1 Tax=Diorhabda carinulata TaxID=1163345 RepID=UPI0025A14786|nr:uncharacterized protein LOC130900396 isoform X1 [Diorhabda carinulata]